MTSLIDTHETLLHNQIQDSGCTRELAPHLEILQRGGRVREIDNDVEYFFSPKDNDELQVVSRETHGRTMPEA